MPYLGRSPGSGVRSRFIYAATSGQTSFSGNDSNSVSLAYEDTLYMDVYQNGVLLKPVTDYAATTGTSVVLTTGATTDDVVEMIVYDTFAVADTVSASNGGTFSGNIAVTGNITTTGTVEPAGDTSAGDNAAIGFTSAEGLILTGQGSTSDITVKNDADATVFTVPTGTDDILFPDNAKILMGAGSDLQIYHDASHSYIVDAGTGNFYLSTNGNGIVMQASLSETMFSALPDGAVTLYHDNSAKIATASTGVDITGAFTATDGCTITTADNTAQLTLTSTDADGSVGPILVMNRNSSSPADNDVMGQILFNGEDDGDNEQEYARIEVTGRDVTDGTEDGQIDIKTLVAGSVRSRMVMNEVETTFNQDSQDIDFRVESDDNVNAFFIDGGNDFVSIGKASDALDTVGSSFSNLQSGGHHYFAVVNSQSSADESAMYMNRTAADGDFIVFRVGNGTKGKIGTNESQVYISGTSRGLRFGHSGSDAQIIPVTASGQASDDNVDLGSASIRFDDIYATTGTLQTSDQNEKQQIASLTSAEMTAAKAISALFKTFKWNSSVTEKGDAARTHTGVIAQEVQTAMTDAGLDASNYAFWCSDTWWETSTEVAAVEADEEANIEARDAYTRIDYYYTSEEAPTGATERTRLGIRYPELMSFVLASIEDRLTALENA